MPFTLSIVIASIVKIMNEKTDKEIEEMYYRSLCPTYTDVGNKRLLIKQVVKNAKGKKSGYYKLKTNQLRAIMAKQ